MRKKKIICFVDFLSKSLQIIIIILMLCITVNIEGDAIVDEFVLSKSISSDNNNISLNVGESYYLKVNPTHINEDIIYELSNNQLIDIIKLNENEYKITGKKSGDLDIIFSYEISNDEEYIINIHIDNNKEIKENYVGNLLETAFKELNYKEKASNSNLNHKNKNTGNKNFTKYGKWYGINPGKWCAMFVSWSAHNSGINNDIIPYFASVQIGMDWFKENNLFKYKEKYTPKAGDIIFFKNNGASRTGIVIASDGNYVYTIEGNTNHSVGKRYYNLNYNKITGYGTPVYPNYYDFNYSSFTYNDAVNGETHNTN